MLTPISRPSICKAIAAGSGSIDAAVIWNALKLVEDDMLGGDKGLAER